MTLLFYYFYHYNILDILSSCIIIYLQEVIKSAKIFGIIPEEEHRDYKRISYQILHKVLLIALLPHNEIENGIMYIETIIKDKFHDNDSETIKWSRFMTNFKNQWIKKITPESFTVFDDVKRTNDYWTNYHFSINGRIGRHPNTYKLLSKKKKYSIAFMYYFIGL